MKQSTPIRPETLIHLETLAQILVGNVVALVILYFYGMSLTQSLSLQVVFFITSYIRSYFIRKTFIRLQEIMNDKTN